MPVFKKSQGEGGGGVVKKMCVRTETEWGFIKHLGVISLLQHWTELSCECKHSTQHFPIGLIEYGKPC